MIQALLYGEIEMWHGHPDLYMNKLEEIWNSPDDSVFGYFIEVDLKYSDSIEEKAKKFPFCPENKSFLNKKYNDFMEKIKPKKCAKAKKLKSDFTDKKNYLIQYRMLKFYARHGMIVDKTHGKFSFKQSKWLQKYTNFNTQKRNKAIKDVGKDFYNLLKNAFYGNTMENKRNRIRVEFFKKRWFKEYN